MALAYPLTFPTSPAPRSITFSSRSQIGMQQSPFSGVQTVYAHQGEWFEAEVMMPPMPREVAEDWVGFLLSLNGHEGTFLMGDPTGATPRGTWAAGSPTFNVSAVHAAGVKTVTLRDFSNGATGKRGDWLQFGSGSTASLHKLAQDFTASAGGAATLEIWPRTRAALAIGDAVTIQSAKGLWRLADNQSRW